MAFIYRGISQDADNKNDRKLRPKGTEKSVSMKRDGKVQKRSGQFERFSSENNAVNAHRIESGLYDGCWLSFTRSEEVAQRFATDYGVTDGVVYVVDEKLFAEYGVVAKEIPNPNFPAEEEVTLRAEHNGDLPDSIIVDRRVVVRPETQ